MLGILVQLLISWLIIWLFEKGNLGFLGFYPTKKRLAGFVIFFIITALCCSSDFFMRMLFAQQQWELNPKLTARTILTGTWWNIKSVLFEELIFRGVLFYVLIKKLGHAKAIIISAICFGIYHWFSQGSIGNPVQMAITFFITGTMGLVYAYSYSKTFSFVHTEISAIVFFKSVRIKNASARKIITTLRAPQQKPLTSFAPISSCKGKRIL